MLGRLFTIVSLLSLLICVATMVLWARSYSSPDETTLGVKEPIYRFWSENGKLGFDNQPEFHRIATIRIRDYIHRWMLQEEIKDIGVGGMRPSIETSEQIEQRKQANQVERNRLSKELQQLPPPPPLPVLNIRSLPHLAIIIPTAILSIGWSWRRGRLGRRRQQLQKQHICTNCGYDLRATPGRCPECGTIAPSSSPEKSSAA